MEKTFADGVIFKRSNNAPDFVIGNLSIKVSEFAKFVKAHAKNDWLNLQVKQSKDGKYYVELDTWQPDKNKTPEKPLPPQPQAALNIPDYDPENDNLPF